ncbi:hypothetical protein [Paenibacillus cymbidii]|uniref:hypothetical protein n=1 Tax=Paenibacillus cymbidii TaxID=1639034 RepID=UPI00108222F0|nr:hypothetical protein [Paenibacillus cymbidii]
MTTIDNIDGFFSSILRASGQFTHQTVYHATKIKLIQNPTGNMHCPKCGDTRKMIISSLYLSTNNEALDQMGLYLLNKGITDSFDEIFPKKVFAALTPSLWNYTCNQCDSVFNSVIYHGPTGISLVVLSSTYGGFSTPNTPESVYYYLDQANKAHLIGANSAAMAMYRAALEHILFNQNFTQKMLGPKIKALNDAIMARTAPKWANELNPKILELINKIGNGAIHPNDGDVKLQSKLDTELLKNVTILFKVLLFVIYEADNKMDSMIKALVDVSDVF